MKTNILSIIVLLCSFAATAQTVVRMRLPAQSENALSVATLYNEALPTGISIVLGVVGYDISGGTAPYQFEWLKNNQVISTGEVAIITPEKGAIYVLRVKDKNNCSIDNAININSSAKAAVNYLSENVKIGLQPTINKLFIDFKGFIPENMQVSIYDLQGKLHEKHVLRESNTIQLNLPNATYLAVIGNSDMYHVEKIIINR